MKKRCRIPMILLAVALFLGLSWPMPASAATLYFTAVNDSVAPLTSDTMPLWFGGTLYVPYSVFDGNLNGVGVGLGLYTSYNRSSGTVTLFNLRQMLVFDLNNGTCRDDMTGTVYVSRAIMRNGRPYLALNTVCSFFELEYSYSLLPNIPQSYLVRIKSVDAVMNDSDFIDAAKTPLNNRLREYTQSLNPAESTAPVEPVNPPAPPVSPIAPSQEDESDTTAYLAFRCKKADGLESVLGVLNGNSRCAVFFLTPQLLEEEGDLIRQILGTGHSIGILVENGENTQEELGRGNRALERAAHTRATLACVPDGQRTALEGEGWVCWKETVLLRPSDTVNSTSFASNTVRQLGKQKQPVCLTLEGEKNAARVLPALLRHLDRENYIVSIPVETML